MKITHRQLRKIINEAFSGYADERPNNPMERHYARMAIVKDYEAWVRETGQVTPAASSVLAAYLIAQRLTQDTEQTGILASKYKMDKLDVASEIKSQSAEAKASRSFKEGNEMKITKSQLKQIIKEELSRLTESDYQRAYVDDKIKQDMFAYLLDVRVYPEELQRYERVDGIPTKLDQPRSYDPPIINPMPSRASMVDTPWGTSGYTSTARDALEAGAKENGWTMDQVSQMHRHLNNMID